MAVDQAKLDAFPGKIIGDTGGCLHIRNRDHRRPTRAVEGPRGRWTGHAKRARLQDRHQRAARRRMARRPDRGRVRGVRPGDRVRGHPHI